MLFQHFLKNSYPELQSVNGLIANFRSQKDGRGFKGWACVFVMENDYQLSS
jgi:hypothetical protein